MKYKVIKDCYKLSEKKYYKVADSIELEIEQATEMLRDGFIEVIDQPKTASEKMTEFKTKTSKKDK